MLVRMLDVSKIINIKVVNLYIIALVVFQTGQWNISYLVILFVILFT